MTILAKYERNFSEKLLSADKSCWCVIYWQMVIRQPGSRESACRNSCIYRLETRAPACGIFTSLFGRKSIVSQQRKPWRSRLSIGIRETQTHSAHICGNWQV